MTLNAFNEKRKKLTEQLEKKKRELEALEKVVENLEKDITKLEDTFILSHFRSSGKTIEEFIGSAEIEVVEKINAAEISLPINNTIHSEKSS